MTVDMAEAAAPVVDKRRPWPGLDAFTLDSLRSRAPSSAAPGSLRKKYAGMSIPQTWYALLLALPHLEIIGSRYKGVRATGRKSDATWHSTRFYRFSILKEYL